jgi:membrane protein required for colicin V production
MESVGLQPYDIVMIVLLVLTTVFGAWKGMAWQIASLTSLVLSAMVAVQFSGSVAPYISDHEPWNRFLAMLLLYVGTSLGVWLVFRLVAGVIDRVRLKEFDHQIGALFGLMKGALLCLVVTFFAVTLSETARQAVLQSRSGYYIAVLIQRANPVLPKEVRGVLGKYIDELDRRLDPTAPPQPTIVDDGKQKAGDTVGRVDEAFENAQGGLDRFQESFEGGLEKVRRFGREVRDQVEKPLGEARQLGDQLQGAADDLKRSTGDLRQSFDETGRQLGEQVESARQLGEQQSSAWRHSFDGTRRQAQEKAEAATQSGRQAADSWGESLDRTRRQVGEQIEAAKQYGRQESDSWRQSFDDWQEEMDAWSEPNRGPARGVRPLEPVPFSPPSDSKPSWDVGARPQSSGSYR